MPTFEIKDRWLEGEEWGGVQLSEKAVEDYKRILADGVPIMDRRVETPADEVEKIGEARLEDGRVLARLYKDVDLEPSAEVGCITALRDSLIVIAIMTAYYFLTNEDTGCEFVKELGCQTES